MWSLNIRADGSYEVNSLKQWEKTRKNVSENLYENTDPQLAAILIDILLDSTEEINKRKTKP
jgi:hypothetical protein